MTSTRTIEIPMFDLDESLAIEAIFRHHGIRFAKTVVHLGASHTGGRHAYAFRVPEDQFPAAVALLKGHYGVPEGDPAGLEACPACGAPVEGAPCCPDCGLNLSGAGGTDWGHPFFRFLRKHGLF